MIRYFKMILFSTPPNEGHDFLGDGEGGGGGGAGGVDDMEGAGFLDYVEILKERAVMGHGLGADA